MDIYTSLQKAYENRQSLFNNKETNCFRLYNSDGDGTRGLSIDLYGEYILIQFFHELLWEKKERVFNAIVQSVEMLPINIKGILLKNRMKHSGNKDFNEIRKSVIVDGFAPPENYSVSQNGIKARVDLIKGQSTGIFLDMREIRQKLVSYYNEKDSLLNLFCYTALFSAHALKNGMKNVINIDLSKTVLQRAKNNYELNNIKYDSRDFIYGDSLDWLRRFKKQDKKFSMVIFDPPTFSRNRRKSFSVKRNYQEGLMYINDIALDGYVLTSINSYYISKDEYFSYHPESWELIFYENESSDFAALERHYLKVGLWKIK